MWPFRSRSVRAQSGGGADATEIALEARQREVRGETVDPRALAVAEACIGLWERALASATVEPDSMELAAVSPAVLALTGRMLATSGNCLFAIEVAGSAGVMLHPAATWDPRGGYRAETRRYYLTMAGPQHTATRDLHGDAVLHFKTGADEAEWWRGRAPLYRSRATGTLAARLEKQMTDETRIPVGRILPMSTGGTALDTFGTIVGNVKEGGLNAVPVGHSSSGFEQAPASRWQPQKTGADPSETLAMLRTHVGQEVVACFGLDPILFEAGGDGSAKREAWRRAWLSSFAPIGRMIEAELRAKLDPAAMVSFPALAAADEDGRSRAIARRATAFKTFRDAGIDRDEALRLAGIDRAA